MSVVPDEMFKDITILFGGADPLVEGIMMKISVELFLFGPVV